MINFFHKKKEIDTQAYIQNLSQQVLVNALPKHVAVMMDGNGRWAINQAKSREFGHRNSLRSVEDTIQSCLELAIPYLTLYAFSTENWQRPIQEINVLMQLFATTIQTKLETLNKNGIKVVFMGELDRLPIDCQDVVKQAMASTEHNKNLHLTVALSYSGRWDIIQAIKKLVPTILAQQLHPDAITPDLFQTYLATHTLPDPDLLIRTGGDMRISNFMLWQLAYTELIILKKYWPEFRKADFYEAILAYQQRERRFGKVSPNL